MPHKKKHFQRLGKRFGRPKHLMIFKKSSHMKRWLLCNPWIRPITVFNYAATRIQTWIRRFLIRSRIHRTGKPFPPKRIRKKIYKPRQLDKYLKFLDRYREKPENKPEWLNTGFSTWCAVRIQSAFRMHRLRQRFNLRNHLVNQVAAIVMQTFWKNCRYQILEHLASQSLHGEDIHHTKHQNHSSPQNMQKSPPIKPLQREDHAVFRIQCCWRAFCNRRIYRYFRDLIVERLSAAPIDLLRTIIPNEAAAFDRAAGTHVRFRLGGWIFPPKIYYKVYTHRPLCDVGSFAPRDYIGEKEETATFINSKLPSLQGYKTGRIKVGARFFNAIVNTTNPSGTKNWYRREENNGWRPIASQLFTSVRRPPWFQPEPTREKVKHFHYNSQYRKELKEKQRAKIKKRWMKKFFASFAAHNHNNVNNSDNHQPESTLLLHSNSDKVLKQSGYTKDGEYHSVVVPPNTLHLLPLSSSLPNLDQMLQEQKARDGIHSQGKSGKVRHGANYVRRGPPVRLPGYLRKEDGVIDDDSSLDKNSNNHHQNNNYGFFQQDAAADLLNWSRTLDYDQYTQEWTYVGCSRPSEYNIAQQPALILGANR